MSILPTSFAAGVGVAVDNKQFATVVEVLKRKILLIGSYVTYTGVDNVPVRISSAGEAGELFGTGSMLHRMALASFAGSYGNVETWCCPQDEDVAAVAATGTITIVTGVDDVTRAGKLVVYIGNDRVSIDAAVGDDETDLAAKLEAAIDGNVNLPVSANAVAGAVTLTAKSKGTWGNGISVTMGWGADETLPEGVTSVTIVETGGAVLGATDPDVADAITALGSGDNANYEHFTDVNIGYGAEDADVLDPIAAYVGWGNTESGLYANTVGRPFRVLHCNTDPKTSITDPLGDAVTFAQLRRYDRANGIIGAPDAPAHPVEIACQTLGALARLNAVRAEEHALDVVLDGLIPGRYFDAADPTEPCPMWTVEYNNRDYAVQNGIGTTLAKGGALTIQNVLTYYNPISVPLANNGYRSMRNISIIQNMLNAVRVNFENAKWDGCTIVVDVAKVGNAVDRAKARDLGSVIDDLLALIEGFGDRAWIYSAAWSKERLAAGGLVTIRPGGTGFDCTLPVLFSGEAGIFNTVIEFDTSLAVLL